MYEQQLRDLCVVKRRGESELVFQTVLDNVDRLGKNRPWDEPRARSDIRVTVKLRNGRLERQNGVDNIMPRLGLEYAPSRITLIHETPGLLNQGDPASPSSAPWTASPRPTSRPGAVKTERTASGTWRVGYMRGRDWGGFGTYVCFASSPSLPPSSWLISCVSFTEYDLSFGSHPSPHQWTGTGYILSSYKPMENRHFGPDTEGGNADIVTVP
ncbi:hypothetical protein DFH09DRAFT_1075855 [Mycena vulgaris]|nr:hypothetical protein DFH09DRAFT_1075855 [Mycena vulgaris]